MTNDEAPRRTPIPTAAGRPKSTMAILKAMEGAAEAARKLDSVFSATKSTSARLKVLADISAYHALRGFPVLRAIKHLQQVEMANKAWATPPILEYLHLLASPRLRFPGGGIQKFHLHDPSIFKAARELRFSCGADSLPLLALGWHLVPEMGLYDLEGARDLPTDKDRNALMTRLLSGYLNDIQEGIFLRLEESVDQFGGTAKVAHRKRHLEAAFRAHRAEDYCLSIPALFAQAEGICADGLGSEVADVFFTSGKKAQKREGGLLRLARKVGERTVVLAAPLTGDSVFGGRIGDYLEGHRQDLNRNAVLHGRDLSFDTETNSLKVISLVSFMIWLIGAPEEFEDTSVAGENLEETPINGTEA